jgi:hypothetical protein
MPYTPTERNRAGEFLMQGITGASQAIAQGVQQWRKDKEESAGYDTLLEVAAARGKSDPKFLEQFGPQLSKSAGSSLSQKRNLVGAITLYEQRRQQDMENEFRAAQIKNFEDDNVRANAFLTLQKEAAARQKEQVDALRRFAIDFGQPVIPGVSSPAVLDAAQLPPAERLRQALGRNPGAMSEDILQTLVRYGDEAAGKPDKRLIETTIGGHKFALSPDTGAFQALPADEMRPGEKQRYLAGLRAQRVDLISSRAKALDDDTKAMIDNELLRLDDELQAMGARPAPTKGGTLDDLWNKYQATLKP